MVDMNGILDVSKRIVRDFDPERIVLFGSRTQEPAKSDADVDLLVILPFEGRGFHKSLEILNRVNPTFSIDLITQTPGEIDRRYREGDPLIRDALDNGTILYERDC